MFFILVHREIYDCTTCFKNLLYACKHATSRRLRRYPPELQERIKVGSTDEEASPPWGASPPPGSTRVDYIMPARNHVKDTQEYSACDIEMAWS